MRSDTITDIRTFASARTVPSIVPARGGIGYQPLRCRGEVRLPSAFSMDVARLLDIDPAVDHWQCQVPLVGIEGVVDFVTHGAGGHEYLVLDFGDRVLPERSRLPLRTRIVTTGDVDPVRLENAKLILPFARWRVSLDDRVRLLAVLDEEGTVTLADCLGIMRNTSRPVAAVASLALAHIIDMDLDEPIGSRTRVIRREA
jgi:hypothetical protein